MRYVTAFLRFWWNFIVGDDWRVAAGLAVAFVVTWVLAHHEVSAWWVLPLAVALLLVASVVREARGGSGAGGPAARSRIRRKESANRPMPS